MLLEPNKSIFDTRLFSEKQYSYTCMVCETEVILAPVYIITHYCIPKDWVSANVCSDLCVTTYILSNL